MNFKTPYYLIDENRLLKNLRIIKQIRDITGVKSVLALKCFSSWCVFDLIKEYLDGTTCSSLYETKLGYETFGKEVHVYCVAYSDDDMNDIKKYAGKIIFNSINQLKKYQSELKDKNIGLRINPGISCSNYDLADPSRKFSRLGVIDKASIYNVINMINGIMFHINCDNDNYESFSKVLDFLEENYQDIFRKVDWLSLGGGILFTKDNYPLDKFCERLKNFSKRYDIQIYLEPGEAAVTESAELVTSVLDIVNNEKKIAIIDASTEAHMLDLLTYRLEAKIDNTAKGNYEYMVAGRSCLAGDIFGTYNFQNPLEIGSIIKFSDAAGYTMVKKNWFNGLQMPSILLKKLDGSIKTVRTFTYEDFKNNLS